MDFVGGLPMSDGKDKIFIVVDRITKYAHFMAVKKTDSTKQIAKVFCKNSYKLHGLPKVIVSDRYIGLREFFGRNFATKSE